MAMSVSAPSSTAAAVSSIAFVSASPAATFSSRPAVGLPPLRRLQVTCSAKKQEVNTASGSASVVGLVASALLTQGPAALALVDERLSGEGTGLSLGISNPLLIWILLGVATLVWALFFTYSSELPEGDDDSGLAL